MIETFPIRVDSVRAQQRAYRRTSALAYLGVLGAGLLIGLSGFFPRANAFGVGFVVFLCGAAAILLRPIAGVYLTVFFAVLADGPTMFWYPFNANFSSTQSILFLHNALTFSPLEVYLLLTAVSWFAHVASARSWHRLGRPLQRPVLIFGAFILMGVVYGVFVRGGDLTIALWEFRPLLYLIAMYAFASNLFTSVEHYVKLAWVVVAAITIQSLDAIYHYWTVPGYERAGMESLTEHPASLMYAWLFLLVVAVCMFRKCSRWARFLLLLAVIPTAYVFVLSERRAAVVALGAGLFVFAVVLFFRRRRAFFVFVPVLLVLTTAYTAAFWDATDGFGFGARAVKSVIAPDDVSARDSASDIYRAIENYNLVYTLRAETLTGVGFGKPFYQPVQLPDISFYVFYQYIPHNSFLWIWLNTGYAGFVAMLFVICATLRAGTHASLRLPSGDSLAVAVCALAFVVMFVVFAYVDIAWDPRCCLFLAVCIATCANVQRLARVAADVGGGRPLPTRSTTR